MNNFSRARWAVDETFNELMEIYSNGGLKSKIGVVKLFIE